MPADTYLPTLNRACEAIDSTHQDMSEPFQRATLLAQMIRSLRPRCPRYACSLRGDESPVLVVVDNLKRQKPKEAESLLEELSKQVVMQSDRAGSPEEWP